MNERIAESVEYYRKYYKKAKKQFLNYRLKGIDPYLLSLDEIVNTDKCSRVSLGEIEVPSELIVGTKTSNRSNSFNKDFLPLSNPNSEFANKWIHVCNLHLSDTGISDAPKAYEYLGKFYIEEGNKRVSVLKSFGAVQITCSVTRLLPLHKESQDVKLYEEFLDYYKISKLYTIQFKKSGYYSLLLSLMGVDPSIPFDRYQRIKLIGFYQRFVYAMKNKGINLYYPDAFLVMIELYDYQTLIDMTDKELYKSILESVQKMKYDKAYYNFLCVGDDEDQALWNGLNNKEIKKYDLIISTGDLKAEYLEYLVTISNKPLLYVHGNHDDKYVDNPPEGCICIDDDLYVYNGIRILGLGGSYRYRSDGKFMYNEKQMKKRILKLWFKIKKAGGVDIVVTHAPVKGYGDLEDIAHQGFKCFEDLIHKYKPKYLLYGHVHRSYNVKMTGSYKIDECEVINVTPKRKILY